ncbi:transposase [Arsenophonus sp. ENCA]|uniref:transposase n=1 Tax=Arsenophonus sp. ENCA TaxID=1987579 RepID=UPI0025B93A7F|nr:transposase [Arsenophonus sp. ENCA]
MLLLDAGYFHDAVIAETKKYQIELFCSENSNRQILRKIYPKALFIYDTEKDIYTCPADHQLSLKSTVLASENTRSYKVYGCVNCAQCEQKKQCTQSKDGRKIKRYPEDKQRDELRLHMATPRVSQSLKKKYKFKNKKK